MRLTDLIALIGTLSKFIPIDKLVALFRAATPIPSTLAEVPAWLPKLSITGPLADVIVAELPNTAARFGDTELAALEGEIADMTLQMTQDANGTYVMASPLPYELVAAAPGIDPATLAQIIALIVQYAPIVLAWIKNRRNPQPVPPTPVPPANV